jgi:hypothetical protein
MVVGMLLYLFSCLSFKHPIHNCFDDEMISLLDLGRPLDAMMLRAPEAEALYEGSAQKGFGFLSIDGSPFPRAQQPPVSP